MPIDSGDVTVAPDGSATGDGLALALYLALVDEYDATPGQLPAASTPGAQENLAKLARGISEPIALGVNEGIEVTVDPGEVLGVALDAGAPQIAGSLTPAQLNAIVGSVALHLAQYLGFGSNPAGVPVGDIRGDGPFAIVGNGLVELGSLGAGGVAIIAAAGPASLHGATLDLEATAGAAAIEATAGIDLSPGANQPVRIASGLVRLIERAAGIALSAGQALLFAKDDTPNNPYFRDDTNADRKIATAPVPLSDFATQGEGTVLMRAVGAGIGVPIAGSGAQLGEIIRFGSTVSDAVGGVFAPYALLATTNTLVFTAAATFHGITGGAEGRELLIVNNAAFGSGINLSFVQFSSSTTGGNVEKILLGTIQGTDSIAVICPPGSCLRLRYTSSRWRQASPIDLAATMPEARIWGRAIGAGSGNATALTPAQIRAIVASAPITEIEETGAGPFNDYNPAGARHILASNAAGVFTGVASAGYVVGDEIVFSHQGTGYSEFQHNTGSSLVNRFFTGRQGLSLRIFDNEIAIFRLIDVTIGGTTDVRWELQSPQFPFAHSSVNANGDALVHNGTNWVTVAGFQTTSNINLTPSGALGVVDISALASGGSVTLEPTANFTIDGFTAKPSGFWFDLINRQTNAVVGTILDQALGATTDVTTPSQARYIIAKRQATRLRYQFSAWRIVEDGRESTSTINLTPSGALGVVDISALQCGGSVTLQPTAAFNIDGFTARVEGFWFDLIYRDTTNHLGTLNENAGATATSIRNPGNVAGEFTSQCVVRMRYQNTRWRSSPTDPLVLLERAAGITVAAGQAQFFAKNDTPNNPYFRDDTNLDRKIATAPVPLSDMATVGQGTSLGRTALGGTGVPVALTGPQQGENLRRNSGVSDNTTTGVVATYVLTETTTHVFFTGTGTITLHGATIIPGKQIEWAVEPGATVEVTFLNDGLPTITQERFRTPSGQPSVTIRAGESVTTTHAFNRHRMGAVCKRIDPELIAPVRNQVGVPFVIPVVLTAGTPGTNDDVTVFNANCPYAIEILRVDLRITAAIAATTIEGRSAAAGGGAALTDTFSGAATGPAAVTAALAAIATIAANGSLFIRRSDRGVGGKIYLTVVRT